MASRLPGLSRWLAACVLGLGFALVALPGTAAAADPSAEPSAQPADVTAATPTPDPTPATPAADPTPAPNPTAKPGPTPAADPTPAPTPEATPAPAPVSPAPVPLPLPTPPGVSPPSMNLFVASDFTFQDPNGAACTATSTRSMLNFIASRATGGDRFLWATTITGEVRDQILSWQRANDTLPGGRGSDPHGWRNALNYYGWGADTLWAGFRVYDDFAYKSYAGAMHDAVRAIILTGKPVGMLGWRGAHAQMITGFYGLVGDPFATDAFGRYVNKFSVAGFYMTDPLKKSKIVNRAVRYLTLKTTRNYRLRFQRYNQKDSTYDDPYTPGYERSVDEWHGKFVLVKPIR